MNKIITICVGLIVAGCATTTQLDEANAKIQDLEKRLASIENARVRSLGFGVRRLVDIAAAEQNRSEEGDKRMMEEQRKQLLSVRDELVRAHESKAAAEEQKRSDGAPATNTIARTTSQPDNGTGGFISARRRREQREAEAAAEDKKRREVEAQREAAAASTAQREAAAERDAEREGQRQQLLAIQEELRRKREAEAVAKEEERKQAVAEKAAKEAEEKKVADAKIDAFLMEHLGVQFGDSIDKFPEEKQDANPNTRRSALLRSRFGGLAGEPMNSADTRNIPVLKKFKYFDKAYGKFFEGKLYRVEFRANIDKKYSFDSTREKINKAVADLSATLGFESPAFKDEPWHEIIPHSRPMNSAPRITVPPSSYSLYKQFREADVRVYAVSFEDSGLRNRLGEEKRKADEEKRKADNEARLKANAEGETLPDPE